MNAQHIGKYFKLYLFSYLTFSMLLSLMLFFRLTFTTLGPDLRVIVGWFNIVFYDFYYYVMPSIAVLFLLLTFKARSEKQSNEKEQPSVRLFYHLIFFFSFFSLFAIFDFIINHPASYIMSPLIAGTIFCYIVRKKLLGYRPLSAKTIMLCLALILILPYSTAFFGFNHALSGVRNLDNDVERIEFVSSYVLDTHTSFWGSGSFYYFPHRANDDFLKFLLVGVSGCGELAYSTITFFDILDLKSRPVNFVGDDHMFVEVNLNDSWLVVDPGYNLILFTQKQRGLERLKEIGGLSYVVTYLNDNQLIDLTEFYAPTDKITITVHNDKEPVTNAKVTLKHQFNGNERSLPSLFTDINGVVEIRLGPLQYNSSKIEPAEPYYWIYVNGKNTHLNVTSTGSGKSVNLDVNLN